MDSMGYLTEMFGLQANYAAQQTPTSKKVWVGYIQQYNPQTGYCTVVNPLNAIMQQDADTIGATSPTGSIPMITNWIPLGSPVAGLASGKNGINSNITNPGFQYAPVGGSSISNPTAGEQVMVIELESDSGYSAAAFLTYNNIALPPGNKPLPVSGATLTNGETVLVTPSGIVIHLDNKGDINLYTPPAADTQTGNVNVIAGGTINISGTTINLTGSEAITITAPVVTIIDTA